MQLNELLHIFGTLADEKCDCRLLNMRKSEFILETQANLTALGHSYFNILQKIDHESKLVMGLYAAIWKTHAAFILACCLTLCRFSLRTPLAVSWAEPCGTAAMGSSQSGVALELNDLNRIQLSASVAVGLNGKVIDLLARRCLPLGHH